jgi:predicted dehydrogenase
MNSIGIIGCGAVTELFYLKVLPLLDKASLKYVFDLNQSRADLLANRSSAESVSLNELLDKSDSVIICTPPESHAALIRQTLEAGKKQITCEKPYLFSTSELNSLEKLSIEMGANIHVAHFRREYPGINLSKSIISSGLFGRVLSVHIAEGGRFNWSAQSTYFTDSVYGGVLLDTGSHLIDSALYICGADEKQLIDVKIFSIEKDKSEPAHNLKADVRLTFEDSSIEMNVTLSRYEILPNHIRIQLERGTIVLPSYLSNYIKLISDNGETTVYAADTFTSNQEAFLSQYRRIYDWNDATRYSSSRFVTLTTILEKLLGAD